METGPGWKMIWECWTTKQSGKSMIDACMTMATMGVGTDYYWDRGSYGGVA